MEYFEMTTHELEKVLEELTEKLMECDDNDEQLIQAIDEEMECIRDIIDSRDTFEEDDED